MKALTFLPASLAGLCVLGATAAVPHADLPISARTADVDSDWTTVSYGPAAAAPQLIGNDGGAASGGLRAWALGDGKGPLRETAHVTPGRTKLVTTAYGVAVAVSNTTAAAAGTRDLVVTIAAPDSFFRLYDAATLAPVGRPLARTLGDWSALCAWRSIDSGAQYVYLFGKAEAVQFLLRGRRGDGDDTGFEMVEVQTFAMPFEASSCAVSAAVRRVYVSGDDDADVYTFPAAEATTAPAVTVLGRADDDVTGLATYVGTQGDYLFVAQEDVIAVYDTAFQPLGTLSLTGDEDIEVQGLGVYQGATEAYPAGVLTYALESKTGQGFGLSSLETAFESLGLGVNTAYDPRQQPSTPPYTPVCGECHHSGFCRGGSRCSGAPSCDCFAGFAGKTCDGFTCRRDCAGHGTCVGANVCRCEAGWGGLDCAFRVVEAVAETDANGGDGDDPAIWVHPGDRSLSRIITTTKSEVGAGLGVFDLDGKLVQTIAAAQPNNVDIIYGFQAGDRTIDLAYAACRGDNTLCMFEMTSNGTLQAIAGGVQPTKADYEVYGSCVYRSRRTGKQYLFVNAKTAEYLQFELAWAEGALQTTLVRNFTGGTGGQVEGCVGDDANGWVLVGEEPYGLWRYGAEPEDEEEERVLIGRVGDGNMYADVEGVTLVEGATADQGYILVSQQGVSAFNVYRRAAPHAFVTTFTVAANAAAGVDAVTNTDGLAAVGAALGARFPRGLVVVHDDANELPDGGTSDEASFKLVSLGDVLGNDDELFRDVDPDWDPRKL